MIFKSGAEIMRDYTRLIEDNDTDDRTNAVEDEDQFSPEDFEPGNGSDNDFDSNEGEFGGSNSDDPVRDLASALAHETGHEESRILSGIQQYLKANNYELVPTHGLENASGNV